MVTKLQAIPKTRQRQPFIAQRSGLIQRRCSDCSRRRSLQRSASMTEHSSISPLANGALRSSGQPLAPETRSLFEARFGHDFSKVRVHSDDRAAKSALLLGASAYTVGEDVVFGSNQYSAGTTRGRQLLAHELTHVVQQASNGGIASIPETVSSPSDDADRRAISAHAVLRCP